MRSAGEALAGRRCERFGERIRQRPHRRSRRELFLIPPRCRTCWVSTSAVLLTPSIPNHSLASLRDPNLSEHICFITVGSDAMSAMRLRAAGHLADTGQPGPRLDVLRGDSTPCRVAGGAGGGRRAVRSQPKPSSSFRIRCLWVQQQVSLQKSPL